ncbi:MAG: hypothetical protein JF565_13035 [Propionibacteriales bacterium]|nr:hypothetical protein [Propionibacteriales bacterium]
MQQPTTPYWSTDAYADDLRGWVESLLGPVEMTQRKLRAWSTVWQVRAGDGAYWVKQNCPSQAFEGALTARLAAWVPERVTLRVEDTVSLARERADLLHGLDPADPCHLDERAWRAVQVGMPAVENAAGALAAVGLPLALNHNDLHDGNAFVAAPGQPLRFFDLADAVLTDPTAALLVPLSMLTDPRAAGAVASAWVEVWREVVDEATLWRVLPDGLRLGRLSRHQAWWRVMSAMTGEELGEWGYALTYWLAKVADPAPDFVVPNR